MTNPIYGTRSEIHIHEIVPGILEKDWAAIEQKFETYKPFAKTVHVDILDGKFAENTTFLDPKPFAKYANDFLLELHMMVEEPIRFLKPFADAGFRRFIGHIEKMSNQAEFVAQAQLLGEVGLAIDGPTPLTTIEVPYNDLDCMVVMTIKAGFSGQVFMPEHLEKVKQIVKKTDIPVEVDGGVNDKTIQHARDAGAKRFVATSFLFKGTDPLTQFSALNNLLLERNS
jgi:ribulose-phosphate 3-epimerase